MNNLLNNCLSTKLGFQILLILIYALNIDYFVKIRILNQNWISN